MENVRSKFSGLKKIIYSVLGSGILWYYANHLSGQYGFLMWIAPVPVLWVSVIVSGRSAFLTSFHAFFLGKLSWFSYLARIFSIVPCLVYISIASLIFALIIIGFRESVLKLNRWYTIFTFPLSITVFEFLLLKFAPDGTAGSMAYSQLNYLPVIQIASITGILGITFLLGLIPSAIALAIYHRNNKSTVRKITFTTALLVLFVLLFGYVRLSESEGLNKDYIKAGLIVLDEKFHHITNKPDLPKEKITVDVYIKEIDSLAAEGAEIMLLPERAINITKENEKEIIDSFTEACKRNKISIVLGYTNYRNDTARNSSLVIDEKGTVSCQYNKARLIKVLEDEFKPGTVPGIFQYRKLNAATAICKDMDFPDYINRYKDVYFLAVPAWDFSVDEWLHSRMAILRSVENGFSQIRSARLGLLTVNDYHGRVIAEKSCANKTKSILLAKVPLKRVSTIYSRLGEWFGVLNVIILLILLIVIGIKKGI